MASDQTIQQLVAQSQAFDDAYNIGASDRIRVAVPTIIGDGNAGPPNRQGIQIQRDAIPIAADELAFQRSLGMEVRARHAAGRYFHQNGDFTAAGAGLADRLPGLPLQAGQKPSVLGPTQLAGNFRGIRPVSVLPPAQTVYYTATPQVGYDW